MIQKFEPISISNESTVVADLGEFVRKETAYQSESDLENQFIELLKDQAYDYLTINSETELIDNLKLKLEKLNNIRPALNFYSINHSRHDSVIYFS